MSSVWTGIRFDRALTLGLVGPLRHLSGGVDRSFPILMYHGIAETDESNRSPYYRLNTAPELFARQMAFLKDHGYRVVGLGHAVELAAMTEGSLPRCVVLTFDDGFRDFHTNAFPVLDHYGYTATVFLPTGFIGRHRQSFKGKECLTWSEVRELHRAGIAFGSHTVTHPQLHTLSGHRVVDEVGRSVTAIAEQLGAPVESFSYPYRFPETDRQFCAFIRAALVEAGCRYGVSTRIGRTSIDDEPYFMRRLPVNSADDLQLFHAKLAGDYDWLHYLQYAGKLLRL